MTFDTTPDGPTGRLALHLQHAHVEFLHRCVVRRLDAHADPAAGVARIDDGVHPKAGGSVVGRRLAVVAGLYFGKKFLMIPYSGIVMLLINTLPFPSEGLMKKLPPFP